METFINSGTFCLEGEVAVHAVVRPHVGVGADVLAQHAGLLAADATFLTDVFTSPTPTHVNILLIRFVSAGLQQDTRAEDDKEIKPTAPCS